MGPPILLYPLVAAVLRRVHLWIEKRVSLIPALA